jgi:pilus assembly protein HofO
MACRQKGAVSSGNNGSTELTPFSPLDFQGDNATLVHWKPLQNGGELTLEAEWQAPGAFSRLAQRDVQIAAFAIAPQGTALRLRLELEHAK